MQARCALSAVQGCKVHAHVQFGEETFLVGFLACSMEASVELLQTG